MLLAGSGPANPSFEDVRLLAWAFEQFPVGVGMSDPDARVLRNNEVMTGLTGRSSDQVRGRLISEAVPGAATAEDERRVLRVAETGVAETTERFVRAPGESKAHAWISTFFPIKDPTGQVRAVGVTAYDYSGQYAARERLVLLSEARTRIGASLDLAGTADELAQVAVPRFADAVSVHLLDAVFAGELPSPALSGSVVLRRAASRSKASAEGGGPANAESIDLASSPVAQCLAGDNAQLLQVDGSAVTRWFGNDPEIAALARPEAPRSLIGVPIRARGALLGLALFLRAGPTRESFNQDDLIVTEDLISRAAICLDNARRFTREHGIAVTLQRALLPHGPAAQSAVETAARYLPAGGGANPGGDWYDVIALPGARVGLVVGDVVGH
jgi:GAF domain-containing protein